MSYGEDGMKTPLAGIMNLLKFVYRNLFELICLNIFFVICSLPVFTLPMAYIALTDTMIAAIKETDNHLLKHYWRVFLHPTMAGYFTVLPILLLEILMGTGLVIYLGATNASPVLWLGCGINGVALGLVVGVEMYLVPWMAASGEHYLQAWKHTFWIAVSKLPFTVMALAGIMLVWGLCIRHFRSCWVCFLLIVFSFSALIATICGTHFVEDLAQIDTKEDTSCTSL